MTARRFTVTLAVLAVLSAARWWAHHRKLELGCCCAPGTWRSQKRRADAS